MGEGEHAHLCWLLAFPSGPRARRVSRVQVRRSKVALEASEGEFGVGRCSAYSLRRGLLYGQCYLLDSV
jgi:hypothetical protein